MELEKLEALVANRYALAITKVLLSVLAAYVVAFVIERTIGALVKKTKTDLDDKIIQIIHRPLVLSVILLGGGNAATGMGLHERTRFYVLATLKTLAILIWVQAAFRIATTVLDAMVRSKRHDIVQARTQPVFDMLLKIAIAGGGAYFVFLVWRIDVTAWLASAGIFGIAVGFAAKDTLANLFSGIFIVADAPYKIGDYIVLDDGLRGRVTSIGIRSTRILTLDDIEITIPNAVIGNSKIINEAGGPAVHQRIGVTVDAAYGSDIDTVHAVLESVPQGMPHVLPHPAPLVRFREFGASGLTHVLYVWIHDPHLRDLVAHQLRTKIYKEFEAAGLEIPYSKHDVYIKEQPPLRAAS